MQEYWMTVVEKEGSLWKLAESLTLSWW